MTALQPLIGSRILTLREQRVMIDADLAELYGVPSSNRCSMRCAS